MEDCLQIGRYNQRKNNVKRYKIGIMIFTTTSVAFILLSLGLAICGWRFFGAFKISGEKEHGKIRLLITLSFIVFAVQNGVLGFGMFFLAQHPLGMFWTLVGAVISLVFAALVSIYTFYYIFFPLCSPKLAMLVISILGIANIVGTFVIHPQPFMTQDNGIDWDLPLSLSVLIFSLLLIGLGAQFYIFRRLYAEARNREIRVLSLVFSTALAIGIVDTFVRFIILRNVESGQIAQLLDFGIALIGIIYIIYVLAMQFLTNIK